VLLDDLLLLFLGEAQKVLLSLMRLGGPSTPSKEEGGRPRLPSRDLG
jgi:hypothetical protein